MSHEVVQPAGWPAPRGYANGIVATGRTLYVAGQIGWDERGVLVGPDLAAQFARALDNVLAVVRAAGGGPTDVVKMTVYVTDVDAYRHAARDIGIAWRDRFGKHYPAMSLVGVAALVVPWSLVEIESVAVLGDRAPGETAPTAATDGGDRP